MFPPEEGAVTGLAGGAAEPKELTIVHIDGLIDPGCGKLGGQSGYQSRDATKPNRQESGTQ
jgi:hypothetical protein